MPSKTKYQRGHGCISLRICQGETSSSAVAEGTRDASASQQLLHNGIYCKIAFLNACNMSLKIIWDGSI